MSIEALLAILTSAGIICLVVGVDRALRHDRTALDMRLRRYGGRAYQLNDDEQKQAASVAVTQLLAKRVEASISGEFLRVVREIGLGVGPQDAMVHLGRRIASDDLELLVIAILVQFEIGGNLSRILDSIASTIRERVKLRGEIRTMSAQGRMAGWVLSGLPVAIGSLLMLIAPSYMGALFTPGPWLVLPVAGLIGIVMGSLTIRKLVAIEV